MKVDSLLGVVAFAMPVGLVKAQLGDMNGARAASTTRH